MFKDLSSTMYLIVLVEIELKLDEFPGCVAKVTLTLSELSLYSGALHPTVVIGSPALDVTLMSVGQ